MSELMAVKLQRAVEMIPVKRAVLQSRNVVA